MASNYLRLQSSFRSFISTEGWANPHAITLTMKQGRWIERPTARSYQLLDNREASNNLRQFLNRLNTHIYGKSARRYGKHVPIIPILEGGNSKRLHYHCMIDCPRNEALEAFPSLISDFWQKTPWGYHEIDIQSSANDGWLEYISKIRDKPNFGDAIDWDNYHLIDRRA